MRDDFSPKTKDILSKRVGMRCSNPECQKPTSGPRNDPTEAVTEASEIAALGPMKLHQADIHLHRGRILRDRSELEKAHALIEECNYFRRKAEFEDAKKMAAHW